MADPHVSNLVMKRGPSRFNMVGQSLPHTLHVTAEAISSGLVRRLHQYALNRMSDAGFGVEEWLCEVSTMDGEIPPSERYYCVEFTNAKGGTIGVQGISTHHGHPHLDHGLYVDHKDII